LIKEHGDDLCAPCPHLIPLILLLLLLLYRLAAVIEDAKTGDVYQAPVGLGFKAKKMYEEFFVKK
jgi:hypothetical protein